MQYNPSFKQFIIIGRISKAWTNKQIYEIFNASIFVEGFERNVEEYIKNYNSDKNMDKEFYNDGDK